MFSSSVAPSRRRSPLFQAKQSLLDSAVLEALERRTLLSNSVTLAPAVNYNLGSNGTEPYSITVADVNGDGIPDMVVANENGTVSVLLGNGNGTFAPPKKYSDGLANGAAFVVVANVDQAFKTPDLIVASRGGTQVSVLITQGGKTGSFQAAQLFNAGSGSNVYSLAVTDLAGDGVEDIVTGNQNDTLSVLKGYNDGMFQAYTTVSLPGSVANIDAVAFQPSKGGPVDLAVTNSQDNNVTSLIGNGDGTFVTGTSYPVGTQPDSVAVADLGGGTVPDLVVGSDDGSVSVLLGNSNGTFATPTTIADVASNVESVAAADFNGDGIPDILVGGETNGRGVIKILFGNGGGQFAATPFSMGTLNYYPNVATAQLVTGDSNPDVLVTNRTSESISVLLNTPTLPPNSSTANISFSNGVVSGMGTDLSDTASITTSGSNVIVTIDQTSDSFPTSSVHLINIDLLGGKDSISIGLGVPACSVSGGGGADTIVANNFASDTLAGGNANDSIHGGGGFELLMGQTGADSLTAGTGHDTLIGGGGADSLIGASRAGESGGEELSGDFGNDTILSGSANDTLSGGEGNDSITGSIGADKLYGGGGNDTVVGGVGNNSIFGNGGNDSVLGDFGGFDSVNGGPGADTIVGDIVVTGKDTLVGLSGMDSIEGGPRDSIISVAGDTVTGGAQFS